MGLSVVEGANHYIFFYSAPESRIVWPMLREAMEYFLTPAPRHIRALGYVHGSVALEARRRRCQTAWEPHLQTCRKLILETVQTLPSCDHLVLIGSGGLHDVPLEHLSETFGSIELWDVVHPLQARKRVQRLSNVDMRTIDITGLTLPVHEWSRSKTSTFPQIEDIELPLDQPPSLVVSLNLLSQLALTFNSFTEGKQKVIEDEDQWSTALQNIHVDWMRDLDCPALIISDLERIYDEGDTHTRELAIPGLDLGDPLHQWDWHIAPKGEIRRGLSLTHKVGAFLWEAS